MRNKWLWIFFSVGTTIGTFLFTCAQPPDASEIVKLPKEAHVTRVEEKGLGGDAWFTLPATQTPEAWLALIARMNGFEKVNDDKWRQPDLGQVAQSNGYVEYTGKEFHATRNISINPGNGGVDFGK